MVRSVSQQFTTSSFVDPSSLSLPSSPSSSVSSPAPVDIQQPPRKRQRSDTSPEERKEARAHRNRIAAQNSRDRRKAQFSYLERRVAELEEENRRLRAGAGLPARMDDDDDMTEREKEKEKEREQENHDLRERIKTLEKGWDAVVKALAAQGIPTPVPAAATTPTPPVTTQDDLSPFPLTTSPAFPVSPASTHSSISSLEHDQQLLTTPSFEPARHLAAGGLEQLVVETAASPAVQADEPTDDEAMETLLREILVAPGSPVHTSQDLAAQQAAPAQVVASDWVAEDEKEMQRLLDMLPDVPRQLDSQQEGEKVEFPSALDLGWDLENTGFGSGLGLNSIGVF